MFITNRRKHHILYEKRHPTYPQPPSGKMKTANKWCAIEKLQSFSIGAAKRATSHAL